MARPITLQTIAMPNFSGANTAFGQGAALLTTGLGDLAQSAGYMTPEQKQKQAIAAAQQGAYDAEAANAGIRAQADLLKGTADIATAEAKLLQAQNAGLPKPMTPSDLATAWKLEVDMEKHAKDKNKARISNYGVEAAMEDIGSGNIQGISDGSYLSTIRKQLHESDLNTWSPGQVNSFMEGYQKTIEEQSKLSAEGQMLSTAAIADLTAQRDTQNALVKQEVDNAVRTMGINPTYVRYLQDTQEVSLKGLQDIMQIEGVDADFFEDVVNTLHRQGYPASEGMLKLVMAESDHRSWFTDATEGRTEGIIREIEAFGAKHAKNYKDYMAVTSFANKAIRDNNLNTDKATKAFQESAAHNRGQGKILTPELVTEFLGTAMDKGGAVRSIAPELQKFLSKMENTYKTTGFKPRMNTSGYGFTTPK